MCCKHNNNSCGGCKQTCCCKQICCCKQVCCCERPKPQCCMMKCCQMPCENGYNENKEYSYNNYKC